MGDFVKAVLAVVVLRLLQSGVSVEAWGADGHHATCLLAEPLLAPATLKAVRSLLPEYAKGSLASLCTWPDDIKWQHQWRWTSPLHYVDTPDFLCRYDYLRDCHNEYGDKDMCVSGAINNFTSQLTSFQLPLDLATPHLMTKHDHPNHYNLTEAILFLAHFVGDIHQPLHVGFTSDLGGNTISVHWYKRKYNLHHIWDSELINTAKQQFYNSSLSVMVDAILLKIGGKWVGETKSWGACANHGISCPDVYAAESISLACKYAYRNATPGSRLADEYFLSRLPIVERRLAQGGVRLAFILNRLFAQTSDSLINQK
ncbi:unnamed protein product [Sphagnum balticum]